jgi:hypothetical protein
VACPHEPIEAVRPACAEGSQGTNRYAFAITSAKGKSLVDAAEFDKRLTDLSARLNGVEVALSVACPGTEGSDCSKYFAVAMTPAGSDTASAVLLFARHDGSATLVGLRQAAERGPSAGGWSKTVHPGTELPERMWFIPWRPN